MSAHRSRPLIIAHRGASAVAPENTLAAFAQAIDQGADGIEFDIQLSADGIPVVIHDSRLRRTAHRSGLVKNIEAVELATLEVGTWFNRLHPRRARAEYENERLPMLEDVLNLVRSRAPSDFICYAELKIEKRDADYPKLVDAVLNSIHSRGVHERTTIVSFDVNALAQMKRIDPAVRTGALFEPRTLTPRRKTAIIEEALACGADEVLLHRLVARTKLIDLAIEKRLAPVIWTVDDSRWLARAERLGLHAIITNRPERFVAASK